MTGQEDDPSGGNPGGAEPGENGDSDRAAGLLDRFRDKTAGVRAAFADHPGGLTIWRVVVLGTGAVCIAAGVVMLITPGPAWVMILLGLGIWATEFRLIRDAADRVYAWLRQMAGRIGDLPRWSLVVATITVVAVAAVAVWLVLA